MKDGLPDYIDPIFDVAVILSLILLTDQDEGLLKLIETDISVNLSRCFCNPHAGLKVEGN